MASADLQEFVALLARSGELRAIAAGVDPSLEAAAVIDRVSKLPGGGPALLFERLAGSRFPLVANLFGSHSRLFLAAGEPDELRLRVERLVASVPGATSEEKGENLPGSDGYARFAPVITAEAPFCREVIEEEPDLTAYPFLKGHSGDGGRFITLPLVFTADPATGRVNCGMYRLQVAGPRTLLVNFGPGSGGGLHLEAHRRRGLRMPVAVALGGDPLLTLAATLPLPEAVDEMWYTGFLRGQSVEMAPCVDLPLAVPAAAEVVIEGYVEPDELLPEGPFANHTGSYTTVKAAPVMRVTRVTRRRCPMIPATVVGKPPVEDCAMARWGGRLMLPWLQVDFSEIADLAFITEAIFHHAAVVSLRSGGRSPQELFPLLRRSRLLKGARLIVFVGEDVPPADFSTVFWKAVNRIGNRSELMIAGGEGEEPLSLGFDATCPGEREFHPDAAIARLIETRWKEYGL